MHFITHLFRPFLALLIFTPFLLVLTGQSPYAQNAQNHFRVESLPRVVKQGEAYPLRALGPASLKSIYVEFQGVRFPMALGEQEGTYEGLIGIDMNTRPAIYPIKIVGTDEGGGVYLSPLSLKVEKVDFGIQKLSLPSSMADLDSKTLERVNQEAGRLKALLQAFRDERLWRGAFIRPVEGELSGAFGLSRIINGRRRSQHAGIDLQAEEGTPVLACNSGMVVLVDQFFFSGKSVILDHGWGLFSMYFHLSETRVKEGDRVNKGAMLGRVGSTGRSTKPHLHWGIRINGARVDPLSLPGVIKTAEKKIEEVGPKR
jgi:murein DD-endopeptidase MepM/ murein hydrolase activator NlpD